MKRCIALVFVILSFSISPASASSDIYLTAPQSRTIDGLFLNDRLAELIAPTGELGISVYRNLRAAKNVYIDIALIEEVEDLVDGYTFLQPTGAETSVEGSTDAKRWLTSLTSGLKGKQLFALPYGNPEYAFLNRNAPAEYRFYKELAQSRLSGFFGLPVQAADSYNAGSRESSKIAREMYAAYRSSLRRIYSYAPSPEVTNSRLELAKIINPQLAEDSIPLVIDPLRERLNQIEDGVRISSGNYTITADRYDLPVTVINDYSIPVNVKLKVRPNNSRVVIGELANVSIPANSQVQVALPIEVIASGETDLEVKLRSLNGRVVGEPVIIPLRLAVISPVATWFTTGMAIILLLAAVIQSMRRVKRRRSA